MLLFSSFLPLIKDAKPTFTVECLAVKIIQSESRRFFRGQVFRRQWVLVFLVFNFYVRKLVDGLSPTARGSPHNRNNVRNNSPETKSNKKGLEASNVKGKNLCNLTTLEKPTNFLGNCMYAMCFIQH